MWEVEIVYGKKAYELAYNQKLEWVSTEYETEYELLPDEIKALFEAKLAEILKVDKVDMSLYEVDVETIKTVKGLDFEIEVEPLDPDSDAEDIEIMIASKGKVTVQG